MENAGIVTIYDDEDGIFPGISPVCLYNRRFQVYAERNAMKGNQGSFLMRSGKNASVKAFSGCNILLRSRKNTWKSVKQQTRLRGE